MARQTDAEVAEAAAAAAAVETLPALKAARGGRAAKKTATSAAPAPGTRRSARVSAIQAAALEAAALEAAAASTAAALETQTPAKTPRKRKAAAAAAAATASADKPAGTPAAKTRKTTKGKGKDKGQDKGKAPEADHDANAAVIDGQTETQPDSQPEAKPPEPLSPFQRLPDELKQMIARFVPGLSRLRLARVDRRAYHGWMGEDEKTIWQGKTRTKYRIDNEPVRCNYCKKPRPSHKRFRRPFCESCCFKVLISSTNAQACYRLTLSDLSRLPREYYYNKYGVECTTFCTLDVKELALRVHGPDYEAKWAAEEAVREARRREIRGFKNQRKAALDERIAAEVPNNSWFDFQARRTGAYNKYISLGKPSTERTLRNVMQAIKENLDSRYGTRYAGPPPVPPSTDPAAVASSSSTPPAESA